MEKRSGKESTEESSRVLYCLVRRPSVAGDSAEFLLVTKAGYPTFPPTKIRSGEDLYSALVRPMEEDIGLSSEGYFPEEELPVIPNAGESPCYEGLSRQWYLYPVVVSLSIEALAGLEKSMDVDGPVRHSLSPTWWSLEEVLKRAEEPNVRAIATYVRDNRKDLLGPPPAPTLETLTAGEIRALAAAALCLPESVVLPWLRMVVAEAHPEFEKDAESGHDDPWLTLVNHLIDLRLLQVVEWEGDSHMPRICRINGLVQMVIRRRMAGDLPALETCLMKVVEARAQFIMQSYLPGDDLSLSVWLDHVYWETKPLDAFATMALKAETEQASWLADCVATCLYYVRDCSRAESLLRKSLELDEKYRGSTHPIISHRLMSLCMVLIMQDKLDEAKSLLDRAWKLKSGHHDLTSTRLLFVRIVLTLLESQSTKILVGQLKTLLAQESLPDYASVGRIWDFAYFIEYLGSRLSFAADFLQALSEALNGHKEFAQLDKFPFWRDRDPQPLD